MGDDDLHVELYDLAQDPEETTNLALDRARHSELLLAMNDKLNRLIDAEVGDDVGQMLPGGIDGDWMATDAVRDV
jgi:arylsulfatase